MADITFTGQVAIITGAGSGIGHAAAVLLAARGARVLVNDCHADGRAVRVAGEIAAAGGRVIANTVAIGTHAAAREITMAALDAFGRIDILINNAGITCPGPFDASSDDDIDSVLAVDLLGPFALMRAVWPNMRRQRYGRILNISSTAILGSGISGAYAAAKAGLIGLTKDAGIAGLAHDVYVNALLPQAYTPLLEHHPDPAFRAWMHLHFAPEPVAAAVAFLVSHEMQESGEMFVAGGGRIARMTFLEAPGYHNRDLTPEDIRKNFGGACSMSDGKIVLTQADHEALTDHLFPGRPRPFSSPRDSS